MRHRLEAENQFNRPQHAAGRIHGGIHDAAFCVGADDEGNGAVSVHVVRTVLRIIFDDEDCGLRPELRVADGFDDLAEGKIIVGDISGGGAMAAR